MVNGVKEGGTFLSQLKHFKCLANTQIDCMHSIFYGVVKSLFRYWFDESGNQSLKHSIDIIDKKLVSIRPPR